jgi:regulator of protease activity HflC (stomatin/prohibitin superfamily)
MSSLNARGSLLRLGFLAVLLLLLVITLFNTALTVSSGFVGVVTTFGKVTGEMQPGFHWKLPYVESVTMMNVQVQKDQTDESAATNDLQTVTSTVALNYHLDHNQVDNVFVNLSPDYADRVISPSISEAVKSVSAKYTASELLTKRPEVAASIQDLLIARLQRRGILVDQFSIVDFKFGSQFSQAIEAKQAAQQDAERAQFNLQKAQLDAQANQVQTSALTDAILEQQAIAKWNGVLPQFVGQGSVFNIPLNK